MKHALPLLAALLFLAPLPPLRAAETLLVDQAAPRAQIVIAAEKRPRMVTLAALELQHHIQTMSGARLPIVTSPDASLPVKIYVGKSAETEKLGVKDDGLNDGAYKMVSGPGWIVLIPGLIILGDHFPPIKKLVEWAKRKAKAHYPGRGGKADA